MKEVKAEQLGNKKMNLLPKMILSAFIVTSGCRAQLPEATDSDLVNLLGNVSYFSQSGTTTKISKGTVECVRLLSGLDGNIYQDAGEELLGSLKTSCRSDLNKKITDTERNKLGFTLTNFEDPELGQRISIIYSNQLAREEFERQQIKEKQYQVNRAEWDLRQTSASAVLKNIPIYEEKFIEACKIWQPKYDETKNYFHRPSNISQGLSFCIPERRVKELDNYKKQANRVLDFEIGENNYPLSWPVLGKYTTDSLKSELDYIYIKIEEIDTFLESKR